jgi:hypothetical protein
VTFSWCPERKQAMKLLALALIVVTTIVSCKKEKSYEGNARIIGIDQNKCACCGGIEFTIDNLPNPNGRNYYLASHLPAGFDIGTNPVFPIPVKITYRVDTSSCMGVYINVLTINRRP